MKKCFTLLVLVLVIFTAISCKKNAPHEPSANTATVTPTVSQSVTITITPTATITCTPLTNILVEDFEDGTLTKNLIDPPNNSWTFTDDLASGGASAWSGQDHCASPGYFGYGALSMSITGTVKASLSTTGQFMGYLNVRTSTMTGGQGIDVRPYGSIEIPVLCTAVAPSGNMLYTIRLYNPAGEFVSVNPVFTNSWSTYLTAFSSFTTTGAWAVEDVLSNLAVIEVRVQLFTPVQDAEATFNLCLDFINIRLP